MTYSMLGLGEISKADRRDWGDAAAAGGGAAVAAGGGAGSVYAQKAQKTHAHNAAYQRSGGVRSAIGHGNPIVHYKLASEYANDARKAARLKWALRGGAGAGVLAAGAGATDAALRRRKHG